VVEAGPAATPRVAVRTLTDDDAVARAFVTGYAFAEDRGEQAVARFAEQYPMEWTRGLFLDGALIASLLVIPYTLCFEGAELRLGGIADVACLPEHRRQGYVARLLRDTLAELHARGMPLSGLYTPHVPLYRRYGWEVATETLLLRFPTKQAALRGGAPPRGHVERVGPDEWRRLDRLYNAWIAGRNSGLRRWETRWRYHVFAGTEHRAGDAAVWVDENGKDQGYAVYRETGWQQGRRGDLEVREVVGLDGDAYRGLLAYLLTHDLTQDTVWWFASEDEPLLCILHDPAIVRVERRHGLLLRIVDLQRAFAQRPCYAPAGTAITIALQDRDCPWNAGCWRLASEGGRVAAERSAEPAALSLDACTLAALFNGSLAPATAATAGLLAVHDPSALEAASALLAVRHRPACSESF